MKWVAENMDLSQLAADLGLGADAAEEVLNAFKGSKASLFTSI